MTLVTFFLLAAVLAAALTWLLLHSRLRRSFLDVPNERSLHQTPKPRIGGLGICVALAVSLALLPAAGFEYPFLFVNVAAGALIVMLISFVDDLVTVGAGIRILFHFAAAATLIAGGTAVRDLLIGGLTVGLSPGLGLTFSVLYVMWIVNLYNFMDGMDGFAGGMTLIGFSTLAWMTATSGEQVLAAISICAAGAAGGFLLFNFPPARVFMGDGGASTLGFFTAALSLWADVVGAVPLWISVLIFSPFIVDASVTLVRRAWNRERLWRAHRNHYYQKLVRLGWGHRKTVLAEYALMIACAASALVVRELGPAGQGAMIVLWVIVYTCLILLIHRMESRRGSDESATTA